MAASANPSASGGGHSNRSNNNNNGNTATNNNGSSSAQEGMSNANRATSNSLAVPDNSVGGLVAPDPDPRSGLRHDPGLSVDWTPEEQVRLEELLSRHSATNVTVRYAKIAKELGDSKTVRDIALRCRWMSKKESGKRRKDDHNLGKKNRDKKEKLTDSMPKSNAANRTNAPPYAQSGKPMDSDDGIPYKAIGGTTGQLLEQSAQALDQISVNFAACKVHENINLLCQVRDNILSVFNDLSNDGPDPMKQMPPLPVKLNEDLANSILPRVSALAKKS